MFRYIKSKLRRDNRAFKYIIRNSADNTPLCFGFDIPDARKKAKRFELEGITTVICDFDLEGRKK